MARHHGICSAHSAHGAPSTRVGSAAHSGSARPALALISKAREGGRLRLGIMSRAVIAAAVEASACRGAAKSKIAFAGARPTPGRLSIMRRAIARASAYAPSAASRQPGERNAHHQSASYSPASSCGIASSSAAPEAAYKRSFRRGSHIRRKHIKLVALGRIFRIGARSAGNKFARVALLPFVATYAKILFTCRIAVSAMALKHRRYRCFFGNVKPMA